MAEVIEYKNIKDWDIETIDSKVSEIRTEMFNMKMQKTTSGMEKPHAQKVYKKNIAKLLTARNAKSKDS